MLSLRRFAFMVFFYCCSSLVVAATSGTLDTVDAKPPVIDLSTPEGTLKSYWALKAWNDLDHRNVTLRYVDLMGQLSTAGAKEFFASIPQRLSTSVERTILEVTLETPTRVAVLVNIKNTTPIPNDAKPTPVQIEMRRKGRDFRYVIVKEGDTWKISEVWALDDNVHRNIYQRMLPVYPAVAPLD